MGVALSLLGEVLLVFLVWAASIALFAFEKQIRELDAATKGGLLLHWWLRGHSNIRLCIQQWLSIYNHDQVESESESPHS